MSAPRAVLVGCGQMSNAWVQALASREDVEIVGLVDVVPEAAKQLAEGATGFLRETTRLEATTAWKGRREHAGGLDEMLRAIAEGRPAETDCRDNVKTIAMVLAAVEGARERRPVAIQAGGDA